MDKEQWDSLAVIRMERATEQVEVLTHNGAMKMFNMKFLCKK